MISLAKNYADFKKMYCFILLENVKYYQKGFLNEKE